MDDIPTWGLPRDLWRDAVAPQRVPGFSNTRWYAKAEIQFVLAENFEKLPGFLRQLDEFNYGEATRRKLQSFFDDGEAALQLKAELAAMLDMRPLVRTTYELEGDRLELIDASVPSHRGASGFWEGPHNSSRRHDSA